jgi:DNA-binding transcriptional MocR family regulator
MFARTDETVLGDYGRTRRSLALRRVLLGRFAEEGLNEDQIKLTASGTQAIDLLCRFLVRLGGAIFVDGPCDFIVFALLHAYQAEIIGVPCTQTEPGIFAFEPALIAKRPRF